MSDKNTLPLTGQEMPEDEASPDTDWLKAYKGLAKEIRRLVKDAEPNAAHYSATGAVAQLAVRYSTLKWQKNIGAQMNILMRALLTFRNIVEDAWRTPTVIDCERFIAQEAGELSSALMRLGIQDKDHFRSTPTPNDIEQRVKNARTELGQLLMMVLTMHELMNVHPETTLNLALKRTITKLIKRNKITLTQVRQAEIAANLANDSDTVEDPRSYCRASYASIISMATDSEGGDR